MMKDVEADQSRIQIAVRRGVNLSWLPRQDVISVRILANASRCDAYISCRDFETTPAAACHVADRSLLLRTRELPPEILRVPRAICPPTSGHSTAGGRSDSAEGEQPQPRPKRRPPIRLRPC